MKPGPEPIPAILVGGGSVLIDGLLEGTSVSLRPDHFGSANAIGAAIAQVSGEVDNIVSLDGQSRQAALDGVIAEARRRAVEAGAAEDTVTLAEIDETPLKGELPRAYVARLAEGKALAVDRAANEVVLAGDTTVAVGRRILEKPVDEADLRRMLGLLSGRRHHVWSGVCVVG
eukprot:gene17992-22968_t